jgi:hypothetical protein
MLATQMLLRPRWKLLVVRLRVSMDGLVAVGGSRTSRPCGQAARNPNGTVRVEDIECT